MLTQSNETLFLVGGIGVPGLQIAKGLVTCSATVDKRVALIPNISSKRDIEELSILGWLVETVDFDDASSLTSAMIGAKMVVYIYWYRCACFRNECRQSSKECRG